MSHLPELPPEPGIPAQLAENLRSIDSELAALRAEIQAGEPQSQSGIWRGGLSRWLKRRLYRLLWWNSYQIKAVVGLLIRWTREERKLIDVGQRAVGQCEDRIHNIETRLQAIESAQLSQASVIERNVAVAREALGQKFADLDQRLQTGAAHRETLAARLSDLGSLTQQTRASLSIQDRRLAFFIEEARKRLPEPFANEDLQRIVKDHTQHQYDSIYASFEDTFRGSREEIKARQSVYLPLLKEYAIGSPAMPVLDLGCGRGEWIELLGEQGFEARGVDSNEAMIDRCRSLGLWVEQCDALPHLRALPGTCVGAVTAFHMVEHMPFDVVLTLVDESLRVLRPGGIMILETPNPANLLVGAYTFHFDPTHLKPLPSPLLKFFVEARGFCDVHVRELHPYPEAARLPDDKGGVASRFNDCLYGPQDYAVIGRKP